MSLKNISLDPFLLSQLYKAPLISSVSGEAEAKEEGLSFLGNNRKQVTVFIKNDRNPWLPDDLFQLLTNILQACRINMDAIALVNQATYPEKKLSDFVEALSPRKIIFLGSKFKEWTGEDLEKNKLGFVDQYQFLWSDSLDILNVDNQAKKEFWIGLQHLFNLKR